MVFVASGWFQGHSWNSSSCTPLPGPWLPTPPRPLQTLRSCLLWLGEPLWQNLLKVRRSNLASGNTGDVILEFVCVASGYHNKAGDSWDPAVPPAAFRCVSIGCFSATRRFGLPSERWTAVRTHQLYAVNKWNNTVRPLYLWQFLTLLILFDYPKEIPATEVARVEGLLGCAVLIVPVGLRLTRTGRPSATVSK